MKKLLKGTDDILRAKCRLSLALLLLVASCGSPPDTSRTKVIVGAQLEPGHDNPRLEHSVIVIRDGKFQAVGPQQSTPVPKGAQMISGSGKLVTPVPSSALIAPGEAADLVLRDAATNAAQMIMHDGEWLK
jgi:hypothetical protein